MRWLLIAMSAYAAEPGYIDPTACRPCHQSIYDSYQKTGMGRSFSKATNLLQGEFVHAASKRQYAVTRRDDGYVLRRTPLLIERSIDYIIGSGNHAQTLVHRGDGGRLVELPLSWYAEKGGHWQMSPGYDRADHSDFRREITDSCLFCHNGYPSAANGGLAMGIDCQRCHGPGESHVRSKGPIVNPAKLSESRRLDVCLQCHLESASRTLPDSIRRFDRTAFSYRPGEPLGDYTIYFEFVKAASDERITVNGAGYGLLKSKCFTSGKLQCVTCHDPHGRVPRDFTTVCKSCHDTKHAATTDNCVGCHMQKRRTEDAVHVVMTDHRIRRKPLAGDLLAAIPEQHGRLSGPVKLLYPATLPETAETKLYLAIANGDAVAIAKTVYSTHAEPYCALGEAYRKSGKTAEAIRAFRRAAELAPLDPKPFVAAADLMLTQGEVDAAIALVEPAIARIPRDERLLNSLAVLYAAKERFADATRLLQTAIKINRDDSLTWLNLGVCRQAMNDKAGAMEAYEMSLTIQPDLARAREFLERAKRER